MAAFDVQTFDLWNKFSTLRKLNLSFEQFLTVRNHFQDHFKDSTANLKPLAGVCHFILIRIIFAYLLFEAALEHVERAMQHTMTPLPKHRDAAQRCQHFDFVLDVVL